MRINHKVLSIPPYLSTSWKNISSLRSKPCGEKHALVIYLQDGSCIEVPDLESLVIQAIFEAHAKYVESEAKQTPSSQVPLEPKAPLKSFEPKDLPLGIKFFEFENMNSMLSHNEADRYSPDLPTYVLSKIESISKDMGLSDSATLPHPEPGCNCPYCQIAKSLQNNVEPHSEKIDVEDVDEEVTDQDLSFTSWIIRPSGENFYSVTHPDNPKEEYQVHLGTPIGCTCGSNQCEHIKAVLSS